jgi:Mg2+ and Co2+ transporter CorA
VGIWWLLLLHPSPAPGDRVLPDPHLDHTTIAAEQVASTGVQQNEDMRRITASVAIVAVPTTVTGLFGQNLPYPGFGTKVGFLASMIVMLALAVTCM